MFRTNLHATTALGLCLAMAAVTKPARSSEIALQDASMFVPTVQSCVVAPTVADCHQIRAMVTDCAGNLDQARCASLFVEADEVLGDSDRLESAQQMLASTSAAIAQMSLAAVEPEGGATAAALATQTGPAEEGRTEAQAAAETDAAPEAAATLDADAEAEQQLREDLDAEQREADETADATEVAAEERAAAEAAALPAADDGIDAAQTEAERDVEVDEETESTRQLREALDVEERAAQGAAAAEITGHDGDIESEDVDATPESSAEVPREPAEDEHDRERERAQLHAEAEAMADEAPELLVEDATDDEFVGPADVPRDLDGDQRDALARLMQDPEIAAAVALLGGMAVGTDEEANTDADSATGQEPPQTGFLAALSALQRHQGDDADADSSAEAQEVIEDAVAADEMRTSRDDFGSPLALDSDASEARRDSRRDLERAGLAALGALAVGMIVDRNRVVARSDERVVVMHDDGEYAIWRDDDVLLREEGSRRHIERFADGSTLSRWDRRDGSQIVTIRDVTGRVIRRDRILSDGTSTELVNDMREAQPVEVSALPTLRRRELRISQRTDPELALALLHQAETDVRELNRSFTLRQVREFREVRELVPELSPEPVTFETNRANIRADEAPKLAQVGRLIERLIAANPNEIFLVEGHTDATGPAALNLALSDRRAESVALALTEFFDIPPENLIIQGYGERHLRIPTAAAEDRNRRVAIRRISPLLSQQVNVGAGGLG